MIGKPLRIYLGRQPTGGTEGARPELEARLAAAFVATNRIGGDTVCASEHKRVAGALITHPHAGGQTTLTRRRRMRPATRAV